MRLIDRYICRQIFSHALLGLGIFTFVFFVPQLVRLMDLVVRHPASWSTIGVLFLCTFPGILSFTLPIGVLVGVLIALGRLSADSELIAMSALGMGRRRLLVPVGILAVGATLITFVMTLWLGPLSVRTFRTIEDRLRAGQASYQVAPRVFDERFPHMVLYVNDIDSAGHALERGLPGWDRHQGRIPPDSGRGSDCNCRPHRGQAGVAPAQRKRSRILSQRSGPLFSFRFGAARLSRSNSKGPKSRALFPSRAFPAAPCALSSRTEQRNATPAWNCSAVSLFHLHVFRSPFWPCLWARVPGAAAARPGF